MEVVNELQIFDAAQLFTPKGRCGIIGCGGFGKVRLCQNATSQWFAIKYFIISGSQIETQQKLEKAMNESKILHKLDHHNIIKVFGITKWEEYIGIVTEYLPGGNLDGFLKNDKLKDIPWQLRLKIASQLSEAISYLHQYKENKELIHGDVKPENVLLDKDLTVKLSDFGSVNIAIHTGASKTMTNLPTNNQHTLYYTAPEFLKDPFNPHTIKMDVYSYGMVLYEILTRMRIFENVQRPPDIVVRVIIDLKQRPDERPLKRIKEDLTLADKKIFEELESQMKKCWSQQAFDRPNIQHVRDRLLTHLNSLSDETMKKVVRNVAKTLNIEEINVDMTEATTLKSAVSPCDDVELPIVTSSKSSFLQKVKSINIFSSMKATTGVSNANSEKLITTITTSPPTEVTNSNSRTSANVTNSAFASTADKDSGETKHLLPIKSTIANTSSTTLVTANTSSATSAYTAVKMTPGPSYSNPRVADNSVSTSNSAIMTQSVRNSTSANRPMFTFMRKVKKLFTIPRHSEIIHGNLQSIKQFIGNNNSKEAVSLCNELMSLSVSSIDENCVVIMNDVITIASYLLQNKAFFTTYQIIEWGVELCDRIEPQRLRLTKLKECAKLMNDVADALKKADRTSEIDEFCLPLLMKLYDMLKNVSGVDFDLEIHRSVCFFYYIGCCYSLTGKFDEAVQRYETAIEMIDKRFSEDAKKFVVTAECYHNCGCGNLELKKYFVAKDQINRSIELYKCAEDISATNRPKKIKEAQENLLRVLNEIARSTHNFAKSLNRFSQ